MRLHCQKATLAFLKKGSLPCASGEADTRGLSTLQLCRLVEPVSLSSLLTL